jgi:hypothetical protein
MLASNIRNILEDSSNLFKKAVYMATLALQNEHLPLLTKIKSRHQKSSYFFKNGIIFILNPLTQRNTDLDIQ